MCPTIYFAIKVSALSLFRLSIFAVDNGFIKVDFSYHLMPVFQISFIIYVEDNGLEAIYTSGCIGPPWPSQI